MKAAGEDRIADLRDAISKLAEDVEELLYTIDPKTRKRLFKKIAKRAKLALDDDDNAALGLVNPHFARLVE